MGLVSIATGRVGVKKTQRAETANKVNREIRDSIFARIRMGWTLREVARANGLTDNEAEEIYTEEWESEKAKATQRAFQDGRMSRWVPRAA